MYNLLNFITAACWLLCLIISLHLNEPWWLVLLYLGLTISYLVIGFIGLYHGHL